MHHGSSRVATMLLWPHTTRIPPVGSVEPPGAVAASLTYGCSPHAACLTTVAGLSSSLA